MVKGLKIFIFFWMTLVLIASLKFAPEAAGFESTSKVLFFHVPMSWIASLAFLVSAIFIVLYLLNRIIKSDIWAFSSASLGFLFCILVTLTGLTCANLVWCSYWHWDSRWISIIILLLVFFSYFFLIISLSHFI